MHFEQGVAKVLALGVDAAKEQPCWIWTRQSRGCTTMSKCLHQHVHWQVGCPLFATNQCIEPSTTPKQIVHFMDFDLMACNPLNTIATKLQAMATSMPHCPHVVVQHTTVSQKHWCGCLENKTFWHVKQTKNNNFWHGFLKCPWKFPKPQNEKGGKGGRGGENANSPWICFFEVEIVVQKTGSCREASRYLTNRLSV